MKNKAKLTEYNIMQLKIVADNENDAYAKFSKWRKKAMKDKRFIPGHDEPFPAKLTTGEYLLFYGYFRAAKQK